MVSRKSSLLQSPWVMSARPRTLSAAAAPVMIGSALAWSQGGFQWVPALLCLGFALLVQIATNYANDYFDGVKGTDTAERIGPVRAVAAGLVTPEAMWRATLLVLFLAFVTGLGLLAYGGWPLLVVGVLSLLCALAYTGGPFPLAYLGLGDLFVVIFFGLVAVMFTFYVQVGYFSWTSLLVGLSCGLVVNTILIVNNVRDIPTDRKAGKMTLAARFGRRFALQEFFCSYLVCLAIPVILWLCSRWNGLVLLPLLLTPLMARNAVDLQRADARDAYLKVLSRTAAVVVLYAVLLSLGLMLGAPGN